MNYTFLIIVLILTTGLAWFGWRYFLLRRRLDILIRSLNRDAFSADRDEIRELEGLAGALVALSARQDARLNASNEERARLAAVLDQMTDAILIANSEGRIQFANPAASGLFGDGMLDRSVSETLRHHQLIQAWQRSQTSGEIISESVEVPARRQFVQMIVIPDRYGSGGSLLLVQDLTRLRRLETVRRDFISNLSHELRTPLASLKALTETLTGGALDDPPAANKFLHQIEIEVDALTQMVSELLELSQIESGRMNLDLKTASMCAMLHSTAGRMRLQADRAGLVLRVECPPDLPELKFDETRIGQVLVNLTHNSLKFTKPGGEVVLSAKAVEAGIQVAVRDNGSGIDPDDLDRIFERFYKSDRSRSGGGTGLGLSIARHIVEDHGGKIWAESEPGRGSTVYFLIPFDKSRQS